MLAVTRFLRTVTRTFLIVSGRLGALATTGPATAGRAIEGAGRTTLGCALITYSNDASLLLPAASTASVRIVCVPGASSIARPVHSASDPVAGPPSTVYVTR